VNKKTLAVIGITLVGVTTYLMIIFNTEPKSNVAPPSYAVNENGQTYGEGPFQAGKDQEPDLIKAVGEHGEEGYIKNADVTPTASSPEEALAKQKEIEKQGYQSVPLYEPDGTTVIGEYRLYPSRTTQ
jgi:hypothetical protein